MKNPFMKDGYMLPVASINSVYIDDTLVGDLFRLELIIDDCIKHKEALKIENTSSHKEIFEGLQSALLNQDDQVRSVALHLAHKYGERLAQLIKTLKKPSKKSKENRINWTEEHWRYWKTVKKIIFVGGVSMPALTKIFLQDIKDTIKKEKIELEISFIEGSVNLGTEALGKKVDDGDALLFDFGQTNIKRRHHAKDGDDIELDMILPCVPSKYLFYKSQNDETLMKTARKLDQYIQDVIIKTIDLTLFDGSKVLIALANYIYKGQIYPNRGGYAKLGLLFDQYEDYLSDALTKKVGRVIDVKLYHDTTAVSYFFEEEKKATIISIGTAFGVAFVDGEEYA
ncbi:MAG: hypothetical protein ACVCEJ_08825 [Candidatus Izemoplasmataceae bacterium]